MTQYIIARAIGISQSTISLIETGQETPSDELLDKIAAYMGVPKKSKKEADRSDLLRSWDEVLRQKKL
jgi:transcriptional regulator with XRE-family HTH domain